MLLIVCCGRCGVVGVSCLVVCRLLCLEICISLFLCCCVVMRFVMCRIIIVFFGFLM